MTRGPRHSGLMKLTPDICIYYSVRDLAVYLGPFVDRITNLGHEGPKDKQFGRMPNYRCAEVIDYDLINPDASHRYRRYSLCEGDSLSRMEQNEFVIRARAEGSPAADCRWKHTTKDRHTGRNRPYDSGRSWRHGDHA